MLACSFCATVDAASWVPHAGLILAVLLVAGIGVAVGATTTWGRRAAGLWAASAALVLLLPAGVLVAGMSSEVDGVVGPPPPDSPDGTWRVRCTGVFPEDLDGGFAALSEGCRDATVVRRAVSVTVAVVGGLTVMGGLVAAVPRQRGAHRPAPLLLSA